MTNRALVIDDSPDVCLVVETLLGRLGYKTTSASDGVEGLRLFSQLRPALVITDLFMPHGDGIETIKEIRRHDRHVPIIAMSGAATTMNFLQIALKLGADAAIAKPFSLKELSDTIARSTPQAVG